MLVTACRKRSCKDVFVTVVQHELPVCEHDVATTYIIRKLMNGYRFVTDLLGHYFSIPFLVH